VFCACSAPLVHAPSKSIPIQIGKTVEINVRLRSLWEAEFTQWEEGARARAAGIHGTSVIIWKTRFFSGRIAENGL
jgi:hypothetical protein